MVTLREMFVHHVGGVHRFTEIFICIQFPWDIVSLMVLHNICCEQEYNEKPWQRSAVESSCFLRTSLHSFISSCFELTAAIREIKSISELFNQLAKGLDRSYWALEGQLHKSINRLNGKY